MKVSVGEVTSQYLKDMEVEPNVQYGVIGETDGWKAARVMFPNGEVHLCLLDGTCAHLEDNSVKVWTVHED